MNSSHNEPSGGLSRKKPGPAPLPNEVKLANARNSQANYWKTRTVKEEYCNSIMRLLSKKNFSEVECGAVLLQSTSSGEGTPLTAWPTDRHRVDSLEKTLLSTPESFDGRPRSQRRDFTTPTFTRDTANQGTFTLRTFIPGLRDSRGPDGNVRPEYESLNEQDPTLFAKPTIPRTDKAGYDAAIKAGFKRRRTAVQNGKVAFWDWLSELLPAQQTIAVTRTTDGPMPNIETFQVWGLTESSLIELPDSSRSQANQDSTVGDQSAGTGKERSEGEMSDVALQPEFWATSEELMELGLLAAPNSDDSGYNGYGDSHNSYGEDGYTEEQLAEALQAFLDSGDHPSDLSWCD